MQVAVPKTVYVAAGGVKGAAPAAPVSVIPIVYNLNQRVCDTSTRDCFTFPKTKTGELPNQLSITLTPKTGTDTYPSVYDVVYKQNENRQRGYWALPTLTFSGSLSSVDNTVPTGIAVLQCVGSDDECTVAGPGRVGDLACLINADASECMYLTEATGTFIKMNRQWRVV